jgi:hypothetical protein
VATALLKGGGNPRGDPADGRKTPCTRQPACGLPVARKCPVIEGRSRRSIVPLTRNSFKTLVTFTPCALPYGSPGLWRRRLDCEPGRAIKALRAGSREGGRARGRESGRAHALRASEASPGCLFSKATPRRGRNIDSIGGVRPLVPGDGGKSGEPSLTPRSKRGLHVHLA